MILILKGPKFVTDFIKHNSKSDFKNCDFIVKIK